MLLECDLGNSRCKWRLINRGHIVDRGVLNYLGVSHAWPLPGSVVTRVRASSVAVTNINTLFNAELAERYGVSAEWAESASSCAGVTNAYADFSCLGVDRWLAMLAAYNGYGAAIVVDAGSALTVDVVDEDGLHLGGYIAPGAMLMSASLSKNTAKVKFGGSSIFQHQIMGQDTAGCVAAGIKAAQLGVVSSAINAVSPRNNASYRIIVTGGDAADLVQSMGIKAEVVPDLVLDGLRWILP